MIDFPLLFTNSTIYAYFILTLTMENTDSWKNIQTKTFTKWVNTKLKKAEYPCIEDIFTDLSSGIAFVNLLRALGKNIENYNPKPFSRIQKMENMKIILEFIKGQGISLVNIGPEDIVDGNQKLILGLIWTLISKMSISDIFNSEFFTMREEILNWIQRVTERYSNVKIDNLTTSWQNGIAFNAIIHRFRPELVPDFFTLDPSKSYENCSNAFKIAEESLDIPKLFDPEDIIDVLKPDEKSILTYLSQFYQKFLAEERHMINKEKLKNILKGIDWSIEARNSYEKRARAFIEQKTNVTKKIDDLAILMKTIIEELEVIEKENTELIEESVELHLLLNDIQDVHKIYNLKPYFPPHNLSTDRITMSYLTPSTILNMNDLKRVINEFENKEATELSRIKDISNEIYTITDKDSQIASLNSSETNFKSIHFTSKLKQNAYDKIRSLFESKKQKLSKYSDLKNNSTSIIEDANKMFKIKDTKNTGFINIVDFKKILRALRFEPNLITDEIGSGDGTISRDRMDEILTRLNYFSMNRSQIKRAFEDASNNENINLSDILENYQVTGLKEIIGENDFISFDSIESLIDE